MGTMQSTLLRGSAIAAALVLPSQALAAWGDENWGEMLWGLPVSVPSLPGIGLIALAFALSATASWMLRKRRPGLGLPVLLVLLAVPLVVAAGTLTVPNSFTNGTTADADQVNDNFGAVKAAVDDNDTRINAAQAAADNAAAAATAADATAGAAALSATSAQGAANTAQAAADANAAGISLSATAISGNTSSISAQTAEIAALQAQVAGLIAGGLRFIACADGLTVADTATGLLWERKTGTAGADVFCETDPGGCPDPHDVNNRYEWSNTGTAADGNAYTDFLVNLNAGSGFAGHTNWRLPVISELQSILVGATVTTTNSGVDPPDPAMGTNPTGQPAVCSSVPCIDPRFALVGGPTALSPYWSVSSQNFSPNFAWTAFFDLFRGVSLDNKTDEKLVRAVRAGSCVN